MFSRCPNAAGSLADKTLIRVLVVDEHTLSRRGVSALLKTDMRFEVVAEAGDAREANRCATEKEQDVILLDNHLSGVKRWMRYSSFTRRTGCNRDRMGAREVRLMPQFCRLRRWTLWAELRRRVVSCAFWPELAQIRPQTARPVKQ